MKHGLKLAGLIAAIALHLPAHAEIVKPFFF